MTRGGWLLIGLVFVPLMVGAYLFPAWRASCCVPDPTTTQRDRALTPAMPREGAPMLGADGIERAIGHVVRHADGRIDAPDFAHGACLRQVEVSWTPSSAPGRAPFPMPAARITWDCLVSVHLRSTGERLHGVLRMVEDPQDRQTRPVLLRGAELRARLAGLGAL